MKYLYSILLGVLLSLASCSKAETDEGGGGGKLEGEVTVRGIIYNNRGEVMSGVVVSDGTKCVKTQSDGRFEIDSDLSKAKFVSVVVPSGYQAPVSKGKSQFYKRLADEAKINNVYQLRFTLESIAGNADRYTLIMAGDPQPRARTAGYDKIGYHALDCCDDMWRDMKEFSATITDRPCYGFMLGDLVHENMNLYANYLEGIAQLGYPTNSVIGNHDNDPKALDDDTGAASFEKNLGPRNYSLNVGRFHIVVLDNLIMKPNSANQLTDYTQGLSDDVWEWLQNDLKHVDRSTPLIVCAHSPLFMLSPGNDRSQSTSTKHGADYALLLSKYKKVYAWAGHTHTAFNYVYTPTSNMPNIEQHTVSRVNGALWTNEWLCDDGTPRGYVVVDINGDDVQWKFRPIAYQSGAASGEVPDYKYRDWTYRDGVAYIGDKRLDDTYQLRAYPRGTYGDNYVYANVFLYDDSWGEVKYTSSAGTTIVMTKVTEQAKMYDAAYAEVFNFYKTNNPTLQNNANYVMDHAVQHLFRCYSSAQTDTGTVSVTDRFGNQFSTTVAW